MKLKVAITCGDINGIGYEVIIKTLSEPHFSEICTPIIYGSMRTFSTHCNSIEDVHINANLINKATEAKAQNVNLINCMDDNVNVQFGEITQEAGKAAFSALERATNDLKNGFVDVLVTAPINKENIQSDKFKFHGHTEYIEAKFATENQTSLMMLVSENIRMALVTNHLPLKEIAPAINKELILRKINIFNESLKKDFGVRKPRIAVLALNPHAGDSGLLGNEEIEIIEPTIVQANKNNILAFGPYSSDGFFGAGTYRNFDGILAMYHDQGLIPFKTLEMDNGVNFTAGLDVVRTSPDHGTGYNIAGKNQANEQSFRSALYAAIDIYGMRNMNEELSENPLRIRDKRINNRE